jgi:hypothetical protein
VGEGKLTQWCGHTHTVGDARTRQCDDDSLSLSLSHTYTGRVVSMFVCVCRFWVYNDLEQQHIKMTVDLSESDHLKDTDQSELQTYQQARFKAQGVWFNAVYIDGQNQTINGDVMVSAQWDPKCKCLCVCLCVCALLLVPSVCLCTHSHDMMMVLWCTALVAVDKVVVEPILSQVLRNANYLGQNCYTDRGLYSNYGPDKDDSHSHTRSCQDVCENVLHGDWDNTYEDCSIKTYASSICAQLSLVQNPTLSDVWTVGDHVGCLPGDNNAYSAGA